MILEEHTFPRQLIKRRGVLRSDKVGAHSVPDNHHDMFGFAGRSRGDGFCCESTSQQNTPGKESNQERKLHLFNLQSTVAPDQKKLRGAGYKFATNHHHWCRSGTAQKGCTHPRLGLTSSSHFGVVA
jgi:hypothetical protein